MRLPRALQHKFGVEKAPRCIDIERQSLDEAVSVALILNTVEEYSRDC